MAAKRKSISKKIRFEVFKRDKFTCQYCGAKSPDAVLNVDHIEPVAKGGTNELINLLTSCADCNSGKGARRLDSNAEVQKQRKEIEALARRREQIEMLKAWRDEEIDNRVTELDFVAGEYSHVVGYNLSDLGLDKLSNLVNRLGAKTVVSAIDEAFSKYGNIEEDGSVSHKTAELVFSKLEAICKAIAIDLKKPGLRKAFYICGILKNRMGYFDKGRAMRVLEEALDQGLDLEDFAREAKTASCWSHWIDYANERVYG